MVAVKGATDEYIELFVESYVSSVDVISLPQFNSSVVFIQFTKVGITIS